MKNLKPKTIQLILLIFTLASTQIYADILVGGNLSLYSINKEAQGIYRTPVNDSNIDFKYKESINYLGFGAIFEAGFAPGHAGIRILPTMYSGSTEVQSSNFSPSVYDLLGFTNKQSNALATAKPSTVKVDEQFIGTAIIFKYNFPVDFKAKSKGLQITQKVLATMNPWMGLGPMQKTFTRRLEAIGQNEFAKSGYTDFYLLLGGGLNLEFSHLFKWYPRNLIVSFDILMSTNLTADNSDSTNDDNLDIAQDGLMFNFGVGYRL